MLKSPITREELYDLVWTTPMCHLAKAYGVSGYRLSQICDVNDIPRPGNDYWPLVRLNVAVERTPLPPVPSDSLLPIVIEPKVKMTRVAVVVPGSDHVPGDSLVKNEEPLEDAKLQVAADFRKAHPLVRAAKNELEEGAVTREGRLKPGYKKKCLAVQVTKDSLRRGLLLMDAILRQLEKKGFVTHLSEGKRGDTLVKVGQESVQIALVEKVERRERKLTPEEMKKSYVWDQYTYHSTGVLQFRIMEYLPKNHRKNWSDGKNRQLDQQLDEIGEAVITTGGVLRLRRLEREEESRRWKEAARLQEIEERKRKSEEAKVIGLMRQAERWHRAEKLKEFVAACRQSMKGDAEVKPDIKRWLAWASSQALSLNPLENGWLKNAVARQDEILAEPDDED